MTAPNPAPRSMRVALMAICLSASAMLGSVVWTWLATSNRFKPSAEASLTAGLTRTWKEVDAAFGERVRSSFPVGGAEKQLEDELRRQGFTWPDRGFPPGEERRAVLRLSDGVCNTVASIHWRSDEHERLTAIRGDYRAEACL